MEILERDKEPSEMLWKKLLNHTSEIELKAMQQRGLNKISRWNLKDQSTPSGLPYAKMDIDDFYQMMALSDRKEKCIKFLRSVKDYGSDVTEEMCQRWARHNTTFVFADTIGQYLFNQLSNNQRNVVIYGGVKNKYISGYDTKEFECVLVVIALEMIDNPVAVKITTNAQIRAAHSSIRMAERICVIEPFTRFTVCLMERLKKGELNIERDGLIGFSTRQIKFYLTKLRPQCSPEKNSMEQ